MFVPWMLVSRMICLLGVGFGFLVYYSGVLFGSIMCCNGTFRGGQCLDSALNLELFLNLDLSFGGWGMTN